MWRRWVAPALVCALVAGCAEVPEKPVEPVATVTPEPKAGRQALQSQPLKHLVGRKLAPIPTRALNVRSACSHRDAMGTRTRLDLQVKNAEVKVFKLEVDIAKRGVCRFDVKQFEQRAKLPQVLLAARNGSGCTVRMWEQGPRTTIAFSGCAAACENGSSDYLWPVLVETRSGRCS